MDLNVKLKYRNGSACFNIYKESPGIYYADLVCFDGDKKLTPPQKITLIRGVRQWRGSFDDADLLNELGRIIEEACSNSSNTSAFN